MWNVGKALYFEQEYFIVNARCCTLTDIVIQFIAIQLKSQYEIRLFWQHHMKTDVQILMTNLLETCFIFC